MGLLSSLAILIPSIQTVQEPHSKCFASRIAGERSSVSKLIPQALASSERSARGGSSGQHIHAGAPDNSLTNACSRSDGCVTGKREHRSNARGIASDQ